MPESQITLYGSHVSGHTHRVQLLLGMLEIPYHFVQALAQRQYLAAEHPTIADLACYSYIAHAPEGGISLEPYPATRSWLSRVESLPRFQPMQCSV
jgi:glutathione S-transferase